MKKSFKEIERVRQLPGMTRAMARTLRKVWDADIDLDAAARTGSATRAGFGGHRTARA